MQQSGNSGGDSQARKNSLAHLCTKTDLMYHRRDPKKIRMDEFAVEINFKFGVPLIILDVIHALTGFDVISQIKKELIPNKYIQRLNPENEQFLNFKN